MARTEVGDPREQQELAQAFTRPPAGALPAPAGAGGMMLEATPVGAQKVAVIRDEAKVLATLKTRAAMAGPGWFYRFPVKNRKTGKTDFIEGPSVKLANSVAQAFGNCVVDVRVIDDGPRWMIYARFADLETGFQLVRPFQQDKGASRMGGTGPEAEARRLDIALQIGVSKATRNVICNALEMFCDFAFDEARKNLVGKIGANLDDYRERAVKWFEQNGVELVRVERAMGRPAKDWLAPDLARLVAEVSAVEDGMATAEETWPREAPPEPKRDDPETPTKGEGGDGEATTPKNWGLPESIIGQEAIVKALYELVDMAETDADIDAVLTQNEARIAKFGTRIRGEFNSEIEKRRKVLKAKGGAS